jgi:hypothetical protein
VNRPGIVERGQLRRPEMVAAVVVGIVLGGVAGATFKGSGMFYSNLILGGGLLLVLALVGLGALVAALTHRTSTARVLAGFVGATVIATGVVYAVAPSYRSPTADLIHRGSVAVHVVEPGVIEWNGTATCRTRWNDPAVFLVWMQHVRVGDQSVAVLLNLGPGSTSVRADKLTIDMLSPTAGTADYIATPGNGLDATSVGADGLTGSVRFSAPLLGNPARAQDPEIDRLSGTLEWACESAPSG